MPDAERSSRAASPPPDWYRALTQYERPNIRLALRQVMTATLPLLVLLGIMFTLVRAHVSYVITLALAVVAAGLLVRSFIFLHDCSHGTFFPSTRANTILGFVIGVLTLTPYQEWRWAHLQHHASFGNLDRRGVGDIMLMTVAEYQAAPRLQQWIYRLYRHPLVLFGIGSTLLFTLVHRVPMRDAPAQVRPSVWFTDLAILGVGVALGLTVGLRSFLLVMAPVWIIGWAVGVWLFYVQHQFQGVYWARQDDWDFFRAALEGSSYYRLPRILQWFTGNIGLHHLHHLRPRIPNYHLQQALDATPAVQAVTPLTLRSSLASLRLRLYDEGERRMVSFHDLRHDSGGHHG